MGARIPHLAEDLPEPGAAGNSACLSNRERYLAKSVGTSLQITVDGYSTPKEVVGATQRRPARWPR